MTTHLSKADVKKADATTQKLQAGFQWTTSHSTIVISAIAIFLVVGGGLAGMSWFQNKAELEAYDQYYQAEKNLMKKKEQFDLYESSSQKAADQSKKAKDKKADEKPQGEKATGKIADDYGPIITDMEKLISQKPGSAAAHLAALSIASLQMKYQQPDEGLKEIDRLKIRSDMLGGLVLYQKARLLTEKKDCNTAISVLDDIAKNSRLGFLHSEAQMKKALCFEAMNDKKKAEEVYLKLIQDEKDSPTGKTAEKFLRLLRLEKNSA